MKEFKENESLLDLKNLPKKIITRKPASIFILIMLALCVVFVISGTAFSQEHRDLPNKAEIYLSEHNNTREADEMLEFLQNATSLVSGGIEKDGEFEGIFSGHIFVFNGEIDRQSLLECEALRSFLDYQILKFYDELEANERAIALESVGSLSFKFYISSDSVDGANLKSFALTADGKKAAKIMEKAGKLILKFMAKKGVLSADEYKTMKEDLDTDPMDINIILN